MRIFVLMVVAMALSVSCSSLPPVVLIPGAGGNQLEAKLSDDYHGSRFACRTFGISYWFRLWLKIPGMLPPFTPCFAERIRLEYNAGTKQFHNPPGIETRVPHFGSTKGMEYLDPNFKHLSGYMNTLVDKLKSEGYKSEKNLFGAPYDFRYAPGLHAADVAVSYLKDLKSLIEKASESNDDKPVVLVAHSLGGLWTLYFLNNQTQDWKERYVHRFVSVSTPWGGTVQEMKLYASGLAENVKFIDPLVLRDEQRSSESNLWMLPVPEVFRSRTLVVGFERNYTAENYEMFFNDIGYPRGYKHYVSRVPDLSRNLTAPGVPVTLMFGGGVNTAETLVYRKAGFEYEPEALFGDGDGTVNMCSLIRVVEDWKKRNGHQLKLVKIQEKTHTSILHDSEAVDAIVEEVLRKDDAILKDSL